MSMKGRLIVAKNRRTERQVATDQRQRYDHRLGCILYLATAVKSLTYFFQSTMYTHSMAARWCHIAISCN